MNERGDSQEPRPDGKERRFRFQFSLRTLFAFVFALAVLLTLLVMSINQGRERAILGAPALQ